MPIQAAALRITLKSARQTAPFNRSCNDSKLKVENVVNAPRKPTVNPSLMALLISGRSSKIVANQPSASEPATFTVKVP